MERKLGEMKGPALGSGMHPGLPNQSIPLWAKGTNMVFEDGAVKVAPGMTQLFIKIAGDPIYGVLALEDGADARLLWGTTESLFYGATPPTPSEVGSGYTAAFAGRWSMVQFGTIQMATHDGDYQIQYAPTLGANFQNIQLEGGDGDAVALRPKILFKTDAFILAMNTSNSSNEIRWCDEDAPLVWIPTATNKARDIQVRAIDSDIVAAVDFANHIAVWGRTQCHILRFIGAPFFFGTEHLISGIGPVGKDAVITVGRHMYGFGPNGIWITDGVTHMYIDQPSVHDYLYGTDGVFDVGRSEHVCTWYDKDNSMVYFSYPTVDGNGETLGYNVPGKVWSMHSFWRTAATEGEQWNVPVTGDAVGNVWGQGLAGAPVSSVPNPLKIWEEVKASGGGYGWYGYGEFGYGGEDVMVEEDYSDTDVWQGVVTAILTLASGEQINLGLALDATGCYIETKALDFGNEQIVKELDRIFSNISDRTEQTALSLEIWGADIEGGPFTKIDDQLLSTRDPMSTLAQGQRFFKFIWRDLATLERWRLHGFTIFGDETGDEY